MLTVISEIQEAFHQRFQIPLPGAERRAALLTGDAERDLRRILSQRRCVLYSQLILENMRELLAPHYPLAVYSILSLPVIPEKARREALERVLDDLAGNADREYPELARMDRIACEGFIRLVNELVRSLQEKRGKISASFFGGRDFGKITSVRLPSPMDAASPRPGGGLPLMLESEGGTFLFKPRDCAAEQVYSLLMREAFPEVGGACDCVAGAASAFTAFVETVPVSGRAEAEAYYERMGVLTAVFFALLSNDMHSSNFIPHGDRPVPIDLETLLSPGFPDKPLPELHVTEQDFFTPCHLPDGRETILFPFALGPDGAVPLQDHEEPYVNGFLRGYRRVMESADRWIGILRAHGDMTLRFCPNSRPVYRTIQNRLLSPDFLRSAEKRDAWLRKVRPRITNPLGMGLPDWELEDLINGEMPDYIIRAGGTDVFRPDGTPVSSGGLDSPLNVTSRRLQALSEAEMETAAGELRGLINTLRG